MYRLPHRYLEGNTEYYSTAYHMVKRVPRYVGTEQDLRYVGM